MATAVNLDRRRGSRLREFANLRQPWFVGLLFAGLIAAQALGFLLLGTGPAGSGLAQSIVVLANLLALVCAWLVFRRAQGIVAIFWFPFAVVLVVWVVPTSLQAYDTLFGQTTLSDSTWRLLYCLYGAPILMMLFLPTYRRARVKSEIFLDLFQVAIVVGLVYSTFFFLPVQRMLPADALLHNVSIANAQSFLLLIAALVRLQFARTPSTRNLLLRLALFLLVCAVATFIGDWIDLHHYASAAAWFNLGWTINQAAAAIIAITWAPSSEAEFTPEPTNFLSFLGTNLALVAMLSCNAWLTNRWKQAYGEFLMEPGDLRIAFRLHAPAGLHPVPPATGGRPAQSRARTARYIPPEDLWPARRCPPPDCRDHPGQRTRKPPSGLYLSGRGLSPHSRTLAPSVSRRFRLHLAAQ